MENLIELATYLDEEYGTIVQYLDKDNNCLFFKEIEENGLLTKTQVSEELNKLLEEKYFSMESDLNE